MIKKKKTEKQKKAFILELEITSVLAMLLSYYIIQFVKVQELNPRGNISEWARLSLLRIMSDPFGLFPIPKMALLYIFLLIAILAYMFFAMEVNSRKNMHYNSDTVNGKAHWLEDLDDFNKKFNEPFGNKKNNGTNNIILTEEISLSLDNDATRRNANIMVIGGSGTGKSYNLIGPNIMQANTNYVITDPSGALYKTYGRFLEHKGYVVKCLNLVETNKSNHYNPLNYVKDEKSISTLVNTIINNTKPPKGVDDDFWEKCVRSITTCILNYLLYYEQDPSKKNMKTLMDMITDANYDAKGQIIDENGNKINSKLDNTIKAALNTYPDFKDSYCYRQYKIFKAGAGKTTKSMLISALTQLQIFIQPDIIKLTDTDDIAIDKLGDEKSALFVICPTGDTTFNAIAAIFYSQLFINLYEYCETTAKFSELVMDSDNQVWKTYRAVDNTESINEARQKAEEFLNAAKKAKIQKNKFFEWYDITEETYGLLGYRGTQKEAEEALEKLRNGKVISNSEQSNSGQRLPIHVRFLLDEFKNTGTIPNFPERVTTIRKYAISVVIILQSTTQLQQLYKEEWESIVGNCDSFLFLGSGLDKNLTEYISTFLGKETRVVQNVSYQSNGKSGSISYNHVGENLLSVAELREISDDDCIFFFRGLPPYMGPKYKANKHPNYGLVHSLNDEARKEGKGDFWFNPLKTEYIYNNNKTASEIVSEKHGGVEKEKDSISKNLDKKNSQEVQLCNEFKNNEDAFGEEIISEPKPLSVNSEESLLGSTPSVKETISVTDDFFEISDFIFSSAEAAA